MLRQNLDALLIRELSSKKLEGDISNSQLSKLRLTARQAILKITSIQKQSSLEERQEITTQAPQDLLVKIGKIEAKIVEPLSSDPIAKEYTLRLIEAVAKKATKEGKENE